jgi:hypothetical protein
MDAADAGKTHATLRHTLAGLQAGVSGALIMMVWSALGSLWSRRSVWMIPNLYATTFYGSRAYVNQFLRSSWSGVALIVAICGIGGIVWGLFWGDRRKPFATLIGAGAGLLLYYASFHLYWNHANPLIPLYAPEPQIEIGYILWGVALARSPLYARRIGLATG